MLLKRLDFKRSVIAAAVLIATASIPRQAHAAFAGTPPEDVIASAAAYAGCLIANGTEDKCRTLAFWVDPTGPGITGLSISIAYDPNKYIFNPLESGFFCQFSLNGACPAPAAAAGTFPLKLIPSSNSTPGQPLTGSTVTLTDSGRVVTLTYTLATPVAATTDTNFFAFVFDFKSPPLIDLSKSTVTYSEFGAGSDFTQTSFSCTTTPLNIGCGSNNGITGTTLNLYTVPEPTSWLLLGSGFVGVLAGRWRW